jgi:hypothetical protein
VVCAELSVPTEAAELKNLGDCKEVAVSKALELPRITAGFFLTASELIRELALFWLALLALGFTVLVLVLESSLDLGFEGFLDLERCLPTLVRPLLSFDISYRSEIFHSKPVTPDTKGNSILANFSSPFS